MVNLGINVIETEGSASPAIAGAPTSIAGLILRSQRGPVNEAIRISNFRQFTNRFGSYDPKYMGAYCVDGFFLNGGREAYVTRVVGEDHQSAEITLEDRIEAETLKVIAGYRGTKDPGSWGNNLSVDIRDNPIASTKLTATINGKTPARLKGEALTNPISVIRSIRLVIDASDGGDDGTTIRVPLDTSTLPNLSSVTATHIVEAINSIAGAKVEASVSREGAIQIASRMLGPGSSISIFSENADGNETLNLLGFRTPESRTARGADRAAAQINSVALEESISVSRALKIRLVDPPTEPVTVLLNSSTLPDPTKVSPKDIVNAINTEFNQRTGPRVIANTTSSGEIQLITQNKGSSASITITGETETSVETPILLGYQTSSSRSATGSVPDPAPSYTEVKVESIAGFQVGNWVRLDDGITQNWHQITELVEREETGKLIYLVQWKEPSAAERNQYHTDDNARLSTCEFDLVVKQRVSSRSGTTQIIERETWEQLTLESDDAPNNAVKTINNTFSGSTYITLEDLNSREFIGSHVPRVGVGFDLEEGNDGKDPNTSDYSSTLQRFDTIPIQLLAILDDLADGVLNAVSVSAIDYCQNETIKGDCMFVGHTPLGRDVSGAKAFGLGLRRAKVFGALYWPWITVTDPIGSGNNPTREIPPTGHVLGVYARIDQTRGVWKAPAGNEASLRGALAVERDITDSDHTDLVKNGSVNGIRRIRGTGIVIDASRTLSTDTRWLFVNVRLLFNFVKASLREGLRWVKQEPNRETLWNKIKYNTVTPFLLGLYQAGAFGPGKPEDVFTVICGPENNPPDQIQLGNLQVEIYFNPGRPAETILITVGQQDGGAQASEN